MVLINRNQQPPAHKQRSCTSINVPTERRSSYGSSSVRSSSFSCAMGDDDSCSVSSISSHPSISSSFNVSFADTKSRRSSTILSNGPLLPSTLSSMGNPTKTSKPLPRWMLPLIYTFTVFSWIRAIQFRSGSFDVLVSLNSEFESLSSQRSQTWKLLMDAKKNHNNVMKQQKKLKKTQRLFDHEIRMIEELYEADTSDSSDLPEIPPETMAKFKNRKSAGVAASWIEHRQEALLHKIYSLQSHIQEESRQNVIQKYGPGPHRVHFHVLSREARKPGDFIVELASIDKMPHSVETFLDMVASKMWDNSVFYHHVTQHHVVAAAPVSYGTFQSKQHQFQALGFNGTSYPEYHKDYPHEKFTIGFAGTGPNFYINTMDNSDHHGPGGQGHHDLATDADPCFGKIVSGFDIVSTDMVMGRHKGKSPTRWEDFDLTRIASIQLMTNTDQRLY
ncbi:cyclophilin type peptidyl-prolyl cis-trans isomerase [Nitzschia inconspicua]|uniref:Cyclophilin type peptidyl-prolyl cis-trans isomerase n=1 Tax=Nitzschia inconspicua TaxID=303405 RepID=A0A9K3LBL2_9STRA|nr:cyclophilin type peptidyl-prolyl cis-trans isomerase [Nitzschia inconspicua]